VSPEDYIRESRRRRNQRFSELIAAHEQLALEGVEAVLDSLAPRLPMALVTSSSREHFELAHRSTAFRRHFSVIVTEEDCTATKPSPEPYLLATRRLGVAPADCVAVEDSPRGLAAATAAGIRCIVMRTELTAHYHFAGAHTVVDDSSALLAAIERMLETSST
jgi:HAD superfamily hydrolase (TIGR01509 family)